MPCTTGSRVAARALAAGTKKPNTMFTKNMPQMTRPTLEALSRARMPRAMRLSRPTSRMTAPTRKANRHSQMTWLVNPAKMMDMGGLPPCQGMAWVMSSSVGMEIPVMPVGMASLTHMTLAQSTMPSTAMPLWVRPGKGGSTVQKRKKSAQAMTKPV